MPMTKLSSASVNDCDDPGCGGARTIMLVLHPRRPAEAVKLDKPIEQMTSTDLSDTLAPLAARAGLDKKRLRDGARGPIKSRRSLRRS
jgi:hypothetical protein